MGYGDGIRKRTRWTRHVPDFARRGVVELTIVGAGAVGAALLALGRHWSH